jgi:hypothetical protein
VGSRSFSPWSRILSYISLLGRTAFDIFIDKFNNAGVYLCSFTAL